MSEVGSRLGIWKAATLVAGGASIASVLIGLFTGNKLLAFAFLGWGSFVTLACAVAWRLRARARGLREVCRGFAEGRYDLRAAVPGKALAGLAVDLNTLGERLQSAQAALTRTTTLLDGALGALSEGVACIDPLDRIVYANPAFSRLVTASAAVTGTPYYLHLADTSVGQAVVSAREAAGQPVKVVDLLRGRQHLRVQAVVGNEEVVVLVLHDLTELKRLETRRRDFMAAVSHELKTPLTSILGFTETALSDEGMDRDTMRGFVEKVARHADRLSSLVRDILTLSRLEQGAWESHPEDIDLVVLAREVLEDLQPAAAENRLRTAVEGPDSLPVRIDPGLVRMLIGNLASNAVRYNRPEGSVTIRIRGEGAGVAIEVEDTGIGIPSEHQARIYERFYRVDSHRSRQSGGTGLGLAIVKHLLQVLDGTIDLRSGPGGTCFSVRLSRQAPAGAAARV